MQLVRYLGNRKITYTLKMPNLVKTLRYTRHINLTWVMPYAFQHQGVTPP